MKFLRFTLLLAFSTALFSCSVFKPNREGCGTNGKNVGAEKVLDQKKSPKFRA